jgi:hypothetical protein
MSDPVIPPVLPGSTPPREPALADAEPDWWEPYAAEFPAWHAWQGVNGAYYARQPGSSPPLWERAESPAELADQVRKVPAPWWRRQR